MASRSSETGADDPKARRGARLRASGVHFLASGAIVGSLLLALTQVWYPHPLFELADGRRIFITLAGCDITLGPLLTLLIFDTRKPRSELVRDVSVIALVQIAALVYGGSTLLQVRPAYIAYSIGTFRVVLANEVTTARAEEGRGDRPAAPWSGPKLVGTSLPEDRDERHRFIQWAVQKHVALFQVPERFVPYATVREDVKAHGVDEDGICAKLDLDHRTVRDAVQHALGSPRDVRFLVATMRDHIALALVDPATGDFLAIAPLPRTTRD